MGCHMTGFVGRSRSRMGARQRCRRLETTLRGKADDMSDPNLSDFDWMSRRRLLTGAAAAFARLAAPPRVFAAGAPTLVTSGRSLSNPYHAVWKQGAEAFAK